MLKITTAIAGRDESLCGRAHVLDGDTIAVAGLHVRLRGVAAPNITHEGPGIQAEAGGEGAVAFLRRLAEGQTVVCALTGERTRGREVGVCRRDGRAPGRR